MTTGPGSEIAISTEWVEFRFRRDGMIHAMEGGLWLHRHTWKGHAMAHLVSVDRGRLLAYGRSVGLPDDRLQYKPLKDPRTGERRDAWHWDLGGKYLPVSDGLTRRELGREAVVQSHRLGAKPGG
jgi:hypothetical protein